jgi:hypothetical protein
LRVETGRVAGALACRRFVQRPLVIDRILAFDDDDAKRAALLCGRYVWG